MPILILLLLLATQTFAETHEVQVWDNYFSPQNVVIEAGDTVRWVNYGNMAHNVVANDLSFRCADGCDDFGGNGNPSNATWQATVTFHQVETIAYFCQPHQSSGMVGSIIVTAPNQSPEVSIAPTGGFQPNQVTIVQGQSVLFTNIAGEHNFAADDNSFQCAEVCRDDHRLGNYLPTGSNWQNYLKFNTAGSFSYHCENPAHSESGVIQVLSDLIFNSGFESNP